MGQMIGKARIHPGATPFVNLPKSLVQSLGQCVVEVAEGYGLSKNELKQVIDISLYEYMRLSDSSLGECSDALFALFNADTPPGSKEELIDSFEFLAAICIVSGMELHEKISFLFDTFEISESGKLSVNEATLAFRASISGTSKISASMNFEDYNDIDGVALEAFELSVPDSLKYSHAMMVEDHKINKQDFFEYVSNCAETISFLGYFGDILNEGRVKPCLENELVKLTPLRFHVPERLKPSLDQPWKDQLRLLKPVRNDSESTQYPPASGLTLDWIHGRNARTPAFYCSCGDVLHAAGSIVVKVSTEEDGACTQEYFMGHSGYVSSIDVFHMEEGGDLVATADIGRESKICVWSSSNLVSIVAIQSLHKCGISKLNFSPSGHLLLTLENGDANSIAVYNWRERNVIFTSKLSTDVYDCSFLSTDNSFGLCTREAVFFWTRREPSMPYLRCRGVFDRLSTREVMTRISVVGSSVITLSLSGRLWVWEGRVCTKLVTLRLGPITQLHAPRKSSNNIGLCVSSHGGSIHLLDRNLEPIHNFRPNKQLDEAERIIDVVCCHPGYERVLFGQKKNCLYQMNAHDKETTTVVASGHPGVRDISVKDENVITVGANIIKIWDAKQHSCLQESCIDATLSCVSCNPREDQIAVGFHADCPRSSLDKSFVVLNGSDLRIIHHGCNSQETLTCCAYSNDGELLLFGSTDSSIYVHQNTDKGFPLLTKIRGHSTKISKIDFGRCSGSRYLRSNSASGEAMFWTTGGKVCTPLSTRDTVWETQTCIYSAAFEKVHSSYIEGNSEVTSCCPLTNHGGQSIIVGDSDGNIRVFPHPYTADRPLFLNYTGHSGAIQSIVVSADCYTVHTMSLRDSCLFQWKRTALSWGQGLPIVSSKNGILPSAGSSSTEMDMESMIKQMGSLDFSTNEGRKDVVRKLRPWTRSIVAPSNFVPSESDLPEINLSLERIHGYNGNGIKNNLHALDDHGDIVYVVGKHLVRHNVEQNSQLFCNLNGEASCLSIHRERSIGVIGLIDQQRASAVAIVDLIQMKSLTFLSNHNGGVVCLNVDDSGKYIVSVSNSREIVVRDWKNGCTVASSQTYGLETLDVKFLKGSSDRIIECGTCFIRFWSIHGCSLRFEEVTLDSLENQTQYYSCIGWNGDNIMVGSSTGQIVPFSGIEPGNRIKAHRSDVTNISSAKNGILTCSNDSVKLWNSSMRCMLSIGTKDVGIKYSISSISWANDAILIASSGNEVWKLSSDGESNLNGVCKVLVSSHASLPLGLSVSSNGSFATTGDDGILRLWNVFDHQEITSFDLNMPSRSCAFSPDLLGRMIAVGFGKPEKENTRIVDGKWIVLSVSKEGEIQTIAERRDVKKYITEMKWHSSGDRLAVGSGDKKLCVYSMKSEQRKPAVKVDITLLSMIDLTSPPIHFDFSVDGKYLRANYECHELHFFEVGPGLHIKESSRLKDVHWETETCIFGWNVQGVWGEGDGAEIVSLDCTPQEPCPSIAAGDRCGDLKLSQFPCTSKAQYMTYPAHLGPVCKVRWLPGYLVSAGMKDNAIMVWRQEVGQGFADRQHLVDSFESRLVDNNATSPSDEFECHSALYDLVDQRVIYPLSGNVEVFDKRRHATDVPIESFRKHDATVVAICTSNSRLLVATADEKTIRLWYSQTSAEIAMLSHERQRNISAVSFSSDDMKVVSASWGGLFIWIAMNGDWSDARLAFHTLAGREKVNFALFDAGRNNIVSGGRRHVHFWSERHSMLALSKGVLSKNCIDETFVCGVSVNDKLLITGTKSGSFVIWEETKIVNEIQAHNDCVMSLRACPEGFISGCTKGVVILWSANLQKVASYDVFAKSTSSPIGSIDMISHSNRCETTKILIRTKSGDIYEISCMTGKVSLLCKIGSSQAAPSAEPNPIKHTLDDHADRRE